MGFESFRVGVSGGSAAFDETDALVRGLPHARPDPGALHLGGRATYYVVSDGRHVIELEVSDDPARVSCRFTLSHPASVDVVFVGVVRQLLDRLGTGAVAVGGAGRRYGADDFPAFAEVTLACIARRRAEWVAMFGPETFAGTTPQVFEHTILPHCVPVATSPA